MTDQEYMTAILETVEFLRDNMATKQDIAEIRLEMATKHDILDIRREMATKEDLREMESRMLEHIDGFAKQNEKFDHELVAAQAKFNRLEERVEVIEAKVGIAV